MSLHENVIKYTGDNSPTLFSNPVGTMTEIKIKQLPVS